MEKSFIRRFSRKLLLLIYWTVAIGFILGCYAGFFFRSYTWPVGLLPLVSAYLLAVFTLLAFIWLLFKSKWCILYPVCVIICWKPITHIIGLRTESVWNNQKQAGQIRVLSWNAAQFNILDGKRKPGHKPAMIQVMNDYEPDIICIQEMVAADTLINLNTPYYKKYSFFTIFDFADQLRMPQFHYSYNFREDFLVHQHFGLTIFSKYPMIRKETVGIYPNGYNDFFQFADIVKGQDTFRVFNIHLQSLRFSRTNLVYIDNPTMDESSDIEKSKSVLGKFKRALMKRKKQADRVREEIDKSPYPVILCGDFNDVPNSYAYHLIGKGMENAFQQCGSGIGRTFSKISPTLRIDNIFASEDHFKFSQYDRNTRNLSDHYPIVADLYYHK